MRPFHSIYNKILDWSSSRFAILWLSFISFFESVIIPLPLQDLLLASMSLRNRSKAFYFAAICTVASVLGAILGYYIGFQAEDGIRDLVRSRGLGDVYKRQAYEQTMKASHIFNLLDARKAISVTDRARFIRRVRSMSQKVAQAYYESRERLGFPMLKK